MSQDQKASSVTLPVSVVIACHSQRRLRHLRAAIESVQAQELKPEEIVITVDHEPDLYRTLREEFPNLTVVENELSRGASGNRNTGVKHSITPLVAFLDDDARARPGWLAALVEPFADPLVVCTGGYVAAAWESQEPRWFPQEFAWVVGASHLGLPVTRAKVRNVWSENMAVRSDVFASVDGFRVDFGKVGTVSRPEDTDLCIRMGKALPGASLLFVPEAVVDHHVGNERTGLMFFLRRSYFEGRGKVELARINSGNDDLTDEQAFLRRTIPQGLLRYVGQGIVKRDGNELRRATALLGGVLAAAIGAAVSLVSQRTVLRRRSAGPVA